MISITKAILGPLIITAEDLQAVLTSSMQKVYSFGKFSETTAFLAASTTKNKRMTGIKDILHTNLYNCLATDKLNEGIIKDSKGDSRKHCVLGKL